MTKGVIENNSGYNSLKSSWGSMSKKFSNIVGNIEILNEALSKKAGSGIQTE
jgi:hypothetical protein